MPTRSILISQRMTKNFIMITLVGIFVIYGCSQKAQLKDNGVNYNGEAFSIFDSVDQIKCTNSGGKAENSICHCPSNHIQDDENFCSIENEQLISNL
jgi:hypothetical protein